MEKMKKLFLLGAMVCALGMMTDCKGAKRTPDAKDSAIVREWARAIGLDFEDCMEERGFL